MGAFQPSADETHDLGTTTSRWKDVHADRLVIAGASNDSSLLTSTIVGHLTIGAAAGNQILDIASHDEVDGGLKLAGTLVTASAAELNILDGVTATTAELNYVDGVTSAIQTQLDAKSPLAGPTFTGTINAANLTLSGNLTVNGTTTTVNSTTVTVDDPIFTLGGDTAPGSDDNKDRGIEFRYYDSEARVGFMGWDNDGDKFVLLKNATNNSEVFSGTAADLAIGALTLGGTAITATADELNYSDGVTSNIQTQLDLKAALASPALTGTPTAPTAAANTNTTQIATTAYVQSELGSYEVVEDTSPQLGGDLDVNGQNILFGDNEKAKFGDGPDLEIYHNGTDSFIDDTGEGSIFIRSGTTYIKNADGTKTSIATNSGAGQSIYFNNTKTLETIDGGAKVTGNLEVTSGIELGNTTDTTITRASAGDINIENNIIYRAGGTDVPVTDGGTGASTAANARTNLGLVIGTNVQAYDADLDNLSDMQTGASAVLAALTSTELGILDDATVSTSELNILDGNTSIGTTAISDGHGIVMNHSGTMAQTTVQTLAAYLDDEITTMPNLESIGNNGSVTVTSTGGTLTLNGTGQALDVDANTISITSTNTAEMVMNANSNDTKTLMLSAGNDGSGEGHLSLTAKTEARIGTSVKYLTLNDGAVSETGLTSINLSPSGVITLASTGGAGTGTISLNTADTSNGIKIATTESGVPVTIGHTTSETTVSDNLTVSGDLSISGEVQYNVTDATGSGADHTVTNGDHIIIHNTEHDIDLPAASNSNAGRELIIINTCTTVGGDGAFNLSVIPNGTQKIFKNASEFSSLTVGPRSTLRLISSGESWYAT